MHESRHEKREAGRRGEVRAVGGRGVIHPAPLRLAVMCSTLISWWGWFFTGGRRTRLVSPERDVKKPLVRRLSCWVTLLLVCRA